jgi:hypothetical protein
MQSGYAEDKKQPEVLVYFLRYNVYTYNHIYKPVFLHVLPIHDAERLAGLVGLPKQGAEVVFRLLTDNRQIGHGPVRRNGTQVPALGLGLHGKSLHLTSCRIDTTVQTVLANVGAANYIWALAWGHTNVSLATTNTATARGPILSTVGQQAATGQIDHHVAAGHEALRLGVKLLAVGA